VNFLKEFFVKILGIEVVNLLEKGLLELLPRVLVFHSPLLHLQENVREAITQVVEYVLGQAGHRAVVGALHCG